MSACTSTAVETSVLTKMASPPFSVMRCTVCCPPSSCMSAITSFAPSRANVRAVALPIPDAPPVTNATLPSTRPAMSRPPVHTDSTATVLVQMLHYVSVYHRPCASYHVTAISRNAASRYQCQVSDGAQTATDDVRITVLNNHPVAIAGPDRNVKTDQPVRLNGSNSFDPDGDLIAYAWSLQAKPARSKLTNAAIKDRTLPNPSVVPDIEGVYVFRLVVADGQEDSPPDFVTL